MVDHELLQAQVPADETDVSYGVGILLLRKLPGKSREALTRMSFDMNVKDKDHSGCPFATSPQFEYPPLCEFGVIRMHVDTLPNSPNTPTRPEEPGAEYGLKT